MLPVNRVDNGRTVVALRYEQRYNGIEGESAMSPIQYKIDPILVYTGNGNNDSARSKLTVSSETEGTAMKAGRNALQSGRSRFTFTFLRRKLSTTIQNPFGQRLDRQKQSSVAIKIRLLA